MERYLERQCVFMPRTTAITYGLHSEVPKEFQGSFGGLLRIRSRMPAPSNNHVEEKYDRVELADVRN
jgi:hypothetical protein